MALPDNRTWSLPTGNLPIGTMYCIGRNYTLHSEEMGAPHTPNPVVFIKPPAAYMPTGSTIALPRFSSNVHHEVELVLVVGKDVWEVADDDAWDVLAGVGVGLDLTARDVQRDAKINGDPWAISKSWIGSAPVSPIVPLSESGRGPWNLRLEVNGQLRQQESTDQMERSIPHLISFLAATFSLRAGDAIFTGTPHGVGPVVAGDVVRASLDKLTELTVRFA